MVLIKRGIHEKNEDGNTREYIINPYQMAANKRKILSYLQIMINMIQLSNYRIDRITGIKMLDENRKPVRELKEREINLPKHMAEHLYMFAGESIHAKFKHRTIL